MKKHFKNTILLALALVSGITCFAQVRETTVYDDGSYYTGHRDAKGRRHGHGLMVWVNGDRYEGDWKKGEIEGEGTFTYAAYGYSYTGHFKKGLIQGHGTFRFTNGNIMEGDWTSIGTGTGYLLFADGSRYDGPFLNGLCHGQGVRSWPNGDRYEGSFVNGRMTGLGKMRSADGSSYDGGWFEDQYEGEGTYISAEGEMIKGRFHAGQLVEQYDL